MRWQVTLFDLDSANFARLHIFKNKTELGAIYQTIYWPILINLLPKKKTAVGSPSIMSSQGYFGLMFLKHYLKLSDEKLLERLNTDWAIQMFCGIQLSDNKMIRDNVSIKSMADEEVFFFKPSFFYEEGLKKKIIVHK